MIKNWDQFEIESIDYLIEKFKKYAKFTRYGGHDSTVPDIFVETVKGKKFYFEAKHCPAQSGQFVLIPNVKTMKFDYSKKNITNFNSYSEKIINYMNKNFLFFKEAGTKGRDICFDEDQKVFSDWIISYYQAKGVRFIITNGNLIFPIEKFYNVFNIKAKYRVKRSGSSSVGKNNISKVKDYLKLNFKFKSLTDNGKKVFIKSDSNLHNKRFFLNKYEFMISKRDDRYEVRKLSNTFNANVIFTIDLNYKSILHKISEKEFIGYIS